MNPSCDDDRVIFIHDKSANNMNKFKQQVSNINWLNLNGLMIQIMPIKAF